MYKTSLAGLSIDREQQYLVDVKRSAFICDTRQDVANICQFEEERYEIPTGQPPYIYTNNKDAIFRWNNVIEYAKKVPR